MNRTRAALAIALALACGPASAAEIGYHPQPNVISLHGMIETGDDTRLAAIVVRAGVIVLLNSPGGYVETALSIGRLVRSRLYATAVGEGSICNSACTMIWLAGSPRNLDRRARLGFHSARADALSWERHEPGNKAMAAYMRGLGDVPQQLIDIQPKADPLSMLFIDHAEAVDWGLVARPKESARTVPAVLRWLSR
jgi:hypothetical protein